MDRVIRWINRIFGWIVCVIVSLLIALLFSFTVYTYTWVSNAELVDGLVVEITKASAAKGRKSYAPRITYEVDGERQEFIPRMRTIGQSLFRVDDQVKLVVSKDRKKVSIFSFTYLYEFPLIGMMLIVVIWVGLMILQQGDTILRFLHPNLT